MADKYAIEMTDNGIRFLLTAARDSVALAEQARAEGSPYADALWYHASRLVLVVQGSTGFKGRQQRLNLAPDLLDFHGWHLRLSAINPTSRREEPPHADRPE